MDFERKQSYLEIPIQVGVRLRPVLDTDDPPSDELVELLPSGQVTVEGHLFDPGFCLPDSVGQQELYMAAVEPQVDMLLQGYNVAVLTFGQTGSGKTYTLVGPDATFAMSEAEFGVLPRAVRHVFAALKSSHEVAEHAFTVRASYLEVGQEEIRDLLNYEAISYHLDVQYDMQGSPVVPGLTRLECSSVSEVLHCLESGSSMRQAGSTAASDLQAHTIFTVHVQQEWADGMLLNETSSSMHFVELSGSELQPAPDDPDDFTINAGLLALRHVIEALARRRPSVPYHLAPLPALLKDVIGGNCRTLVLCCLSPADTDESLNSLQYVRLLPAVHNLVACGASQRPLPPEPEPPQPEPGGPGPARQVHPVHPLRHLQAGSPRPEVKTGAAASWQAGPGFSAGFGGEMDTPGAGWGVTPSGGGGGYPVEYGGFGQEVTGMRRLSSVQQRLSHGQATMSPAQQMMGQNQQMMGQNQQVMGLNQHMVGQNQLMVGQNQQMVNPNQPMMSPSQPMMNQSQQMLNLNQQVMNQNQALINPNQQIMNQNQALMAHNQNQQEQPLLNQNQPLLNQNQPLLNQNQPLLNQNHQPLLNQNQSLLNQNQPLLSPNQLALNQSHQMNLNQSLSPLNQPPPLLNHGHHNLNLTQQPLNQSLPALNQSFPTLNHPMSVANHGHLLNQTLPVFGSHQSLALSPARAAGGHQSALVHPYHHQASPAGRLAGLGYTASPPLTNLTELSCQRAALLHENALVDLYQRLHVLELHQLAAAQQAALAAQAPPPLPEREPEKQEDDQLFQLEFAAEQYRRLVSGAERLLRELAGRGAVDGEQSGRIQQWMCSKQETEECLRQEQEQEGELRRLGSGGSEPETDGEGSRRPADSVSNAGVSSVTGISRPAASTTAADVYDLGESLSSALRLGDRSAALDTTPSAVAGEPTDASTPNGNAAVTRRTVAATDQLQARVKQLNATLVAKEAQIRALTDGGSARRGSSDAPELSVGDPADQQKPPVGSEDQEKAPGRSPDGENASGDSRDRGRASIATTPAAQQIGGGSRPRSPSSDPFQRRRRQACTEEDLRVLRDSDGLEALRERLTDDTGGPGTALEVAGAGPAATEPPEPAGTPATDRRGDRVSGVDPADPDADLEPGCADADDEAVVRREIQLLRECRESLHNQRRRINAKLHQGRQLDAAETRRLLELDEAMHAVDEVLEHKACRLAGGAPPEDARRLLLNQRQLMPRLLGLAAAELRLLYCRTFQRLVDQRIDGREKDLAVADLDGQTEEQVRGLKRLQRMVHDLMRERSHYRRQRDELRRRLHGPRGSGTTPLAAAAPPPPPPAAAAAHGLPLDPAAAAVVQSAIQPAPLVHSRAASDASSAPEPVLAPTSAPHRLRQMLLSGLSRPVASTPTARVTRQRNRIIIQSASQPTEKRTKR